MAGRISSTSVVLPLSILIASSLALFAFWTLNRKRKVKVTLEDENKKYSLKLIEKFEVSHNTRKFRFALPSDEHVLGLPVGQFVYLSAKVNGKLVVRPYTPISAVHQKGHLELMIKIYKKGTDERFPEGGRMTQHLDSLNIGDTMDFRGPSGLIVYEGNGTFAIRPDKKTAPKSRKFRRLAMIAGGSGITPILQVINAILHDPNDPTQMSLIFANQTEHDILCREELEQLAANHPTRFHLWYTISRPVDKEKWKYSIGYVDADMISSHLPSPAEDTAVLLCGPPAMINSACIPNLDKLGHHKDCILIF